MKSKTKPFSTCSKSIITCSKYIEDVERVKLKLEIKVEDVTTCFHIH